MCYISLDREKFRLLFYILVHIKGHIVFEISANYQNGRKSSVSILKVRLTHSQCTFVKGQKTCVCPEEDSLTELMARPSKRNSKVGYLQQNIYKLCGNLQVMLSDGEE